MRPSLRVLALSLALLALTATAVPGQGAIPLTADRPGPMHYFFRSLAVPGWGQAQLDRKLTGALFLATEGVALTMGLKAHQELRYLERTGSDRVQDKRNERQDWFFVMAVNHLLSGMEAYVSASLYDFPGDLQARALGHGRTGIGVTLPIGRRR